VTELTSGISTHNAVHTVRDRVAVDLNVRRTGDNDAGAVSTYSQAGAQYGTHLLWVVLLLLPVTYFIQEMVVRLGIATGKGHAAMIYQRFGKWWGLFSLIDLELVNFLTLVTEFAAINLALNRRVDPRMCTTGSGGPVLIAVTALSPPRSASRFSHAC
jgi:Mn2+/Fe2+ NRAMP family transporter